MAFSITYPLVWQLERVVSSTHAPTDPHKKWGSTSIYGPRTWKSGGSTDPLDPVAPRPLGHIRAGWTCCLTPYIHLLISMAELEISGLSVHLTVQRWTPIIARFKSLKAVWISVASHEDWRNQVKTGWSLANNVIRHLSEKMRSCFCIFPGSTNALYRDRGKRCHYIFASSFAACWSIF